MKYVRFERVPETASGEKRSIWVNRDHVLTFWRLSGSGTGMNLIEYETPLYLVDEPELVAARLGDGR